MRFTLRVSQISDDTLRYARQLGLRHIIGYVRDDNGSFGWDYQGLLRLREFVAKHGLELAAIGSPDAQAMGEIIRGGAERDTALRQVTDAIRAMGAVGIPVLGYSFSVLPNWGRWRDGLQGGGRGDAGVMSFNHALVRDAPPTELGVMPAGQVWDNLRWFLERAVPVAEEAGVRLACHPDDPPVTELRGIARIQTNPAEIQQLLDTVPSPANSLTFCLGTVAEMPGVDPIATLRGFVEQGRVAVIHFRNVRRLSDREVNYDESFIDEGDVDMLAALRALVDAGYDGLCDPDHAPVMVGDSQWGRERGYAFALGYMTALRRALGAA